MRGLIKTLRTKVSKEMEKKMICHLKMRTMVSKELTKAIKMKMKKMK
jgi:hypothetical protein